MFALPVAAPLEFLFPVVFHVSEMISFFFFSEMKLACPRGTAGRSSDDGRGLLLLSCDYCWFAGWLAGARLFALWSNFAHGWTIPFLLPFQFYYDALDRF